MQGTSRCVCRSTNITGIQGSLPSFSPKYLEISYSYDLIGAEGLREGFTKTNVTVDLRSVSRRQSAWIVDADKLEKRREHDVIC